MLVRLIDFYELLILVYCLASWFPIPREGVVHDLLQAIASLVEPYLGLFRRFIPPLGGVDFSPVVAIVVLGLIPRLFYNILL